MSIRSVLVLSDSHVISIFNVFTQLIPVTIPVTLPVTLSRQIIGTAADRNVRERKFRGMSWGWKEGPLGYYSLICWVVVSIFRLALETHIGGWQCRLAVSVQNTIATVTYGSIYFIVKSFSKSLIIFYHKIIWILKAIIIDFYKSCFIYIIKAMFLN